MLKNNKEREEYIRNEENWIDYYTVIDGINIKLSHLKGTNIRRIYLKSIPLYYNDEPRFIEIACKEFSEKDDRLMKSIYDLTINQLIAYLRENKV